MAECSTIYCGSCEYDHVTTNATKWCTDCTEGYCGECVKAHRVNRSLRDHHIISVNDYFKISSVSETQSCPNHKKAYDFFCPAHDKIVCVTCVQTAHTRCGDILAIETAAKNAKMSPLILDIENTLTIILENIDIGLKHQEKNITSIGEDENSIKRKLKQIRNDLNKKLDEAEEKLVKEVAQRRSKCIVEMNNSIHALKKKKKNFTDMKEKVSNMKTVASDLQVFVASRQINETIYKENELVRSLLMACQQYNLQLATGKAASTSVPSLGILEVQRSSAALTYREPKSTQAQILATRLGNANVGTFRLKKEITIEKEVGKQLTLTCCQILPNKGLVFGDYWNNQLIFHDEDGTFNGEFKMNAHVSNITSIAGSKVAVAHGYDGSFVEVVNTDVRLNEKTMSFAQTIGGITFHNDKLYLDVIGDSIYVSDLNAKVTSTIPVGKTPKLKKLEILGNNIYYADQVNNKVVCCDMEGKSVWEFRDNRIVKNASVTLDQSGNVYVVGYDANVILKISNKGKDCKVILDESNKVIKPVGIHCDRRRKLFLVCNENNGHAALYDIG